MVAVRVDRYPYAGVVGFQVEEYAYGDWVNVLDTSSVGTFPNYTTTYAITPIGPGVDRSRFRARWETGVGQFTPWFTPSLVQTLSDEDTERVKSAIIYKAVRFLKLPEAPFGHSGMTEWGVARVLPDFEIEELLYGLRFREFDVDLTALVSWSDVVRVGLQLDPSDWHGEQADVQRAIDSAVSWVAHKMQLGVGIA